jgi:hypothetical protein
MPTARVTKSGAVLAAARAAALVAALAGAGWAGAAPPELIPADRRTTWNPGIPGGVPTVTAAHTTIDAARYGNGKADATAVISQALKAAGAAATAAHPAVVYLPPGTYRTTGIIELRWSHVILRGAGAERTHLRFEGTDEGSPAVRMGVFWPEYRPPVDVVGSVPKGAQSLTVADARGIQVGDVLQIDQLDDPSYVVIGDQIYGKRGPRPDDVNGPSSPGGYRSVGQQVEVVSKDGNTLGLLGPTHIAFDARFSPQVFKTATAREGEPGTRGVGLEALEVAGGRNNDIVMLNTAYGWIQGVESNGDPASGPGMTGAHIALIHCFRCEVRASYVHHARRIAPGGGAYGIAVGTQSSDNLIEDNIAVHLNKPILLAGTGGGNVVAYNYVDDAYIETHATWQETGIDANHGAFSHHDLFEGNQAPNIGSDSTHGNCGWETFFRNYATGMNGTVLRSANIRAVGIDGFNREHNVIGNVLLQPGLSVGGAKPVFLSTSKVTLPFPAVYRIGSGSLGGPIEKFDDGTALKLLYRHGNFDYLTNKVEWDPNNPVRDLPASLFRTSKPAFFGDLPWPFVDPLRDPPVGVLPAKKRYDAIQGQGGVRP